MSPLLISTVLPISTVLLISTVPQPWDPPCTFARLFPRDASRCKLQGWRPRITLVLAALFPGRLLGFKPAKTWPLIRGNFNESVFGQVLANLSHLTDGVMVLSSMRLQRLPKFIGPMRSVQYHMFHSVRLVSFLYK